MREGLRKAIADRVGGECMNLREIKIRKLFVAGTRSLVIRDGSFSLGLECSEMECSPRHAYLGSPLPSHFVPVHTSKSATSDTFLSVARIFLICAWPEIFSSIVECVSIFVVNLLTKFQSEYGPVHGDFFGCPLGVETFALDIEACGPVPLRQPFKILHIDNSVLSLRERYKAIRLIEWLHDFVSGAQFHFSILPRWSLSNVA